MGTFKLKIFEEPTRIIGFCRLKDPKSAKRTNMKIFIRDGWLKAEYKRPVGKMKAFYRVYLKYDDISAKAEFMDFLPKDFADWFERISVI